MKLQANTGGPTKEIQISREGGRLTASVDDRTYDLEVSEPEPGIYLLKHEGNIYEAAVTGANPTHVRIGSDEFDVTLIDPKRLRSAGSGADHADGIAEIKTAMPGKVVRVLVDRGAVVEKGDGILVVEAMKMQNEMKSPKSGTVKEVRVAEGATVSAGDILATIE
jgi:biotin carboxyl carrier protein